MIFKMQPKTLVFIVVYLTPLLALVVSKSRRVSRLQSDPLTKTRCDLICYDVSQENKAQCRSRCRLEQQKPGTCPAADSPKWAAACVEACNSDSQCDGTQRCCHHGCGSSCSEPLDLLLIPGLPALPVLDDPKERKKTVFIRWSDGVGDTARAVPERTLYILEEQHHLGPKYEEARLGEWNLVLRTNKTKVSLRNLLKPGRWYRFRVAAISAAGTRGFSKPSSAFTPRKGPRPPQPPRRLRVRQIGSDNGTVTVRLDWKMPRSDLPVIKYKVFWSRRVRGLSGELDSVLVNHQTVPKDQSYVEIKDLQPNSMYFLQLQTISQFGLGKLRSNKAAVFFNTTSANDREQPESLQRRPRKITGLKSHQIVWYNHKLKGKISWDSFRQKNSDKLRRYYVHWKAVKCENKPVANQKKELSATTEETSFEIYELDYHCTYKVNVNKSWKPKSPDSELTINVPDCNYFRQKAHNSTAINCN